MQFFSLAMISRVDPMTGVHDWNEVSFQWCCMMVQGYQLFTLSFIIIVGRLNDFKRIPKIKIKIIAKVNSYLDLSLN